MLEKNIGPLTKAMNHGGSFSLDTNPQSLMRILFVVECLCIKEESIICVYVVPVWMSKLRIIKSEKSKMRAFSLDLCTGGIEVPLCDTWLKHMLCNDNPCKSKLIRTRCEHYW